MRFLLAMVIGVASTTGCNGAEEPTESRRHALLVGCTRYGNVPGAFLEGPGNDVKLMRRLLSERFDFAETDVRILAESMDHDDLRPTRANIEREFQRLAKVAKRGDQVVIFLAGHGAAQPDNDPENPDDPEPDGRDEVFCPADVTQVKPSTTGPIPNAIADDEIHAWLDSILDQGASVWFIVDACHSGTLVRGGGEERDRMIPAEMLGLDSSPGSSATIRGRSNETSRGVPNEPIAFEVTRQPDRLVATYAAQPNEATPEVPLPKDDANREYHGLFTYTLAKVLMEARTAVTYRELVSRIHAQYVKSGRSTPTPLVEGPDRDREVLGRKTWPDRSRILVHRDAENGLIASAGAIVGLSRGTVLAVYPPPGAAPADKPLGYVRVSEARLVESVVTPCGFDGLPARDDLPVGARCEVAQMAYGDLRLRLAVDRARLADEGLTSELDRLQRLAPKLAEGDDRLITWTEDVSNADWLLGPRDGQVYLIPAHGSSAAPGHIGSTLVGPMPGTNQVKWLGDRLRRIARAQNLLQITSQTEEDNWQGWGGSDLNVEFNVQRRADGEDGEAAEVTWERGGRTLRTGESIRFSVKNRSAESIDVTLLFVDSAYGIHSFLLKHPEYTNRLEKNGEGWTNWLKVSDTTVGLEHVVMIAARGRGAIMADFSWLEQPALPDAISRGSNDTTLDTPLGRLFKYGMYGVGQRRGLAEEEAEDAVLKVRSWNTRAK